MRVRFQKIIHHNKIISFYFFILFIFYFYKFLMYLFIFLGRKEKAWGFAISCKTHKGYPPTRSLTSPVQVQMWCVYTNTVAFIVSCLLSWFTFTAQPHSSPELKPTSAGKPRISVFKNVAGPHQVYIVNKLKVEVNKGFEQHLLCFSLCRKQNNNSFCTSSTSSIFSSSVERWVMSINSFCQSKNIWEKMGLFFAKSTQWRSDFFCLHGI